VHRGVLLTAIENRPLQTIIDTMFEYLSADGYNLTHKYQTISNRGPFGSLYTALYGAKPKYNIQYIDSLGRQKSADVSIYTFTPDTTRRQRRSPTQQPSRKERRKQNLLFNRRLSFDSSLNMAVMDLNTFTRGFHLRRFFRRSFKQLNRRGTENLVIDLRSNGGGSVTNSNLLTKYIADQPFKIADSLYALSRRNKYGKYQGERISNWLFLLFMTHKKSDGHYHFRYFERKQFKPKENNHYKGHVYILTGGNTFSASTLFAQAVREQENVTIVGEETGGGAYGNNAWLIPDVTLPVTKVRFRLPLFRLVINKDFPKTGRGVIPEVEALPTVKDIRKNNDYKMEKTRSLIKANK
jgi:C-terminal processing protease CtpA/Prc